MKLKILNVATVLIICLSFYSFIPNSNFNNKAYNKNFSCIGSIRLENGTTKTLTTVKITTDANPGQIYSAGVPPFGNGSVSTNTAGIGPLVGENYIQFSSTVNVTSIQVYDTNHGNPVLIYSSGGGTGYQFPFSCNIFCCSGITIRVH